MFERILISTLHHLLVQESWARERLRGFAGRHVRILGGPLKLNLVVDQEGLFRQPDASFLGEPDVVIELPADAPLRFLADRDSIFASVKLSGAVDFAETLAFVFRNLRWDVEEDLARLTGDVVAHRLVKAGSAFLGWQKKAAANLVANGTEYLKEESDMVVAKPEMEKFSGDVRRVSDELATLERRIELLAQ